MFKLLGKLPDTPKLGVAVSGGSDSMGVLGFLLKSHSKRLVIVHFNHGTTFGERAEEFVHEISQHRRLQCVTEHVSGGVPAGVSTEEWWREQRYKFFHSLDFPVITGHTLNDCMETWLFGTMHGQPKLIPYNNKNVIRPFMLATREDLARCAQNWIEDPSNSDLNHPRNRIRHNIMPEVLKVNPGFATVIRKRLLEINKTVDK